MFGTLFKILRNQGRFTAVEYRIMAALTIVAVEQMAMKI